MKPIYVEIERLMKLADEKKIALECTKMEAEEDIKKVTFYANNEKIIYSDLLEKLQKKKKRRINGKTNFSTSC